MRKFDKRFIDKVGDDLEKLVVDMQRTATLDIWNMLTRATPVDTGRARASWIATTRQPSDDEPPEGAPTYPLNRPSLGNTKLGIPNFVVSNLVYMSRLNEGHSEQAPTMFVERAVAKGWAAANRRIRTELQRRGF